MKTWNTKSGLHITQLLSRRSNVFLLSNGEKNILIDTGTKGNWKKLNKKLQELKIHSLDYILLTHTHFDHAANSSRLKKQFKALLIVHSSEAEFLENGKNIIPMGTNVFTRFFVRVGKIFADKLNYGPCPYDILIDSSIYDLKSTGCNAYIMHTPGHSPGSVSVIVDDEIAIVGDAMFGVFKGSVFPPFADDIIQMINSWGKLLDTKCRIYIPGHGTAISRDLLKREYLKRKKS